MPRGNKGNPPSTSLKETLANEHAAITDRIPEYEKILKENPNEKWIAGQLKYWKQRRRDLEKLLGISENR